MMQAKNAGANIRKTRREKDMTQAQLAAATGYSVSEISLIERGRRKVPLERITAIGEALGLGSPLELFFDPDFLFL